MPLGQQYGSTTSTTSENFPDGDHFDLSLGLPGGAASPQDIPSSSHPLGAILSGNHVANSSGKAGEVTSPPRRFSDVTTLSWKPGEVSTSSRKPSDNDSPPEGLSSLTSPLQIPSDLASPPQRTNDVISPPRRLSDLMRSPQMSSSSGKGSDPRHVSKLSETSWEVLSKFSSTSHRLSIQQDLSDPQHNLVPLWECLQVYMYLQAHVYLLLHRSTIAPPPGLHMTERGGP